MKAKKVTKFDFTINNVWGAVLQETRVKREDELYPITFRITFDRVQRRYKSGIKLTEKQWETINTKGLKQTREEIQKGLDDLKAIIKDIKPFSFVVFNKKLGKGKTNLLLEAFEFKVKELTKAGRIGTAEYYNSSSKMIKKFAHPGVKISDVTVDWLQRFEAWMTEKKKSVTTIAMYQRAVRSIFNEYSEGLDYPFKDYEIPESSGRKIALNLEQIGKIASAPLITETEKRCRDLWLFSYLCNGINFADLLRLRYSDISGDEIRWDRKKTFREKRDKSKTVAFYLPEMDEIVKHWGNPERQPDQFIFPFLHAKVTPTQEKRITTNVTRLINKKMKELGKRLGIGSVTTYTARHSFATIMMQSGVSVAFISKALSHSSIATTQAYLGS
jgi:integrase